MTLIVNAPRVITVIDDEDRRNATADVIDPGVIRSLCNACTVQSRSRYGKPEYFLRSQIRQD